ncbi:DNA polymerase II large subunit [Candidatus Woesearchaeota archaeon]|nr:DNA polymerase II large subunit [Candidatus Woesearchaeota archaeon]
MTQLSNKMKEYFGELDTKLKNCYDVANTARSLGFDPSDKVEIPLARDMAERVEGLVSVVAPQMKGSGLSGRINELEQQHGSQNWLIAFLIAEEVAEEKFCKFSDKKEAMEVGLRVGLAYITNGVVSSPLEGFIKLELKKRLDGKGEYFCLYFGGPIRSAGTTATCIFVAVSDYIRIKMGYSTYDPTEEEINRTFAELEHFHDRITNLQYFPSKKEADFLTKSLPVQIDGDPSEKIDVPNYKNLSRIYTNKLRNGFCLVMAEGLSQKFAKFWNKFSKWNKEIGMGHWGFLEDYVVLQKQIRAKGKIKEATTKIVPDFNYIKDLVAGRPILGSPLSVGSFRVRFGRARTTGLSDSAVHPATMIILDSFIASGTQLKTERPGKSTVISCCDSIEGPIVKLKNGDVLFLETEEEARIVIKEIQEVLFLGDILLNYGYFLNRGHLLAPVGYNEDWWALELEGVLGEYKEEYKDLVTYPNKLKLSFIQAFEITKKFKVPLHPRFTYHWGDINFDSFLSLIDWLSFAVVKDEKIIIPILQEDTNKRILELIGVPHKFVGGEYIVIEGDWALAFRVSLGFYGLSFNLKNIKEIASESLSVLEIINKISEAKIMDKSGLYVGSRMGRPEKAKMRKLIGSPHSLFPVGKEGGRLRCFQEALEKCAVTAQFSIYFCNKCNKKVIYPKCIFCGETTKKIFTCNKCESNDGKCNHSPLSYENLSLGIKEYFDNTLKALGIRNSPELIKGVRGTSNKQHIPENLAKGILRAVHEIYVNKDGTTRYDMTEMSLTHFKPKEIGTDIEILKKLGYTHDIYSDELINDEQILELRCQDIVLPSCPESQDEGADFVLYRVSKFIDDLLEKFYKIQKFYNLNSRNNLVGHLVVGLSPHTAAGIVGRIIGFSKTQTMLCSPLFHSIMRRDCDGDEATVMLLMDALINFSPKLLSDHRGATQDEPLVLTTTILPTEVDDMVFDMDIVWRYPLELYKAALEYKPANEVKIKTLKTELGKEGQYEGWGFTHDTTNINSGVRCSIYKILPTMQEKVEKQMALCEKLRCVDVNDVARLVIERHFIRDIKGNLRKFSMQQFRCVNCNEKFRRPPLKGNCIKCNGRILFTISEGTVIKYLQPSLSLAEKYKLPPYLKQTLELSKQRIELLFGKEKEKQEGLGKWFG